MRKEGMAAAIRALEANADQMTPAEYVAKAKAILANQGDEPLFVVLDSEERERRLK